MRFVLTLLLLCLGAPALAAICTSLGSGNWSAATTWSCGAVPVAEDDIVIANGHTVTVDVAAVGRDLTINNGNANSSVVISGANSLTLSRNVVVYANTNGITKLLDVAGGTLSVGRDLTLVSTGGGTRIARLAIGTGSAAVARNLTANDPREQVVFSAAGTLRIGGNFTNSGTLTAATGTVVYNGGGAQSIGAYTYNNLIVAKAAGTATFGGDVSVRGNFTNNGGFNGISGNRTATFSGAAAQSIGGTAGSSSFYRINLNNASGLTINHNVTVSNRFNFQNGRVTTGANLLSVGISNTSPGTITGSNATRYVVGNLARWIRAAGGSVSYDFPVGTTVRALVNLRFRAVTTGNYMRVATFNGDHPQISSSGIDPARSVNRYWSVANLGVVFNTASVQRRMIFNWVAADVDGGASTSAFIAKRYAAGAWSDTDPTPARTATSITLEPYLDFGEFAVGEHLAVVVPGGFDGLEPSAVFNPLNVPGNMNPIRTKVSGAAMSIDIAALTPAKDAIQTTFVGDVKIELLDASNNSGTLDANGCRPTWTLLSGFAPPTLTFAAADNGRKNITLTESNAWRNVRLRMTYPATGAPQAIGCSTDNFATRPATLGVAVTDLDWQNAGTTRTLNNTTFPSGTVHKAGRPFTITVTGYNALGAVTTNYNGSPAANVVGCVLPTSCTAGTLSPGTFTGTGGTVVSNTATYSEVGAFQLQMSDASFAAVDAADGSSVAQRTAYSGVTNVGRFVPDHFTLTSGTVTAACGAFTYMDQPFQSLTARIEARNAANAVTVNYNSQGFSSSLATVAWQAENADNGSNLSARLNVSAPSPLWNSGVYTVSTAAASFRRATSPDNPDGPFDNLQLGVLLTDPDAVALNGLDMNASTAGACAPCNAKKVGAATRVRFGRLRLSNAHGSELRALPLTVRSEYWSGSGFAINSADACTSLSAGVFSLSNWQRYLNPGETALAAGGPWTATDGLFSGPRLTAPGPDNQGSVDVTIDLSAMPWLLGRWDGTDQAGDGTWYDDNPTARATFGIYRDRFIFRREVTH